MMNVKAGDLIKSYDFSAELQPGCYMVGLVESAVDGVISCKMIKSFFAGEEYVHPHKEGGFKTLVQGMGFFDDESTRIEMIATAEEIEMVKAHYAEEVMH